MPNFETLSVTQEGSIATITVSRPDALNALNATVLRELAEAAIALADDDSLDAVIVTGAGRAFVAGADIKAMVDFGEGEARDFSQLGHRAFKLISDIPVPVIAAINGFALGGGLELALACDLLYGSEKAQMGLPEVSLSVVPGWGGTQRLGRLIGWHHARELIFTGKRIKADEALRIGLLLQVFGVDELLPAVTEIARTIAANGPLAVRAVKSAMKRGADADLTAGFAFESAAFGQLFGTDDQREGMSAFVERRAPEFSRS